MNNNYTKAIITFLLTILITTSVFTTKVYFSELQKRNLKIDLVELSDSKYGMFNVDKWKEKISIIISKKINELEITGENRQEARKKIIKFLNKSITEFEGNYKKKNREKAFLGISIRNIGADFFSIFDEFRDNIPQISDRILDFLEKKENRTKIKDYILSQMEEYSDSTFQKIDYTNYNYILEKYNSKSDTQCKITISNKIELIKQKIFTNNIIVIIATFLLFLIIVFNKKYSKIIIAIYILIALNFLLLGLLLPMIDIDARIGSMQFKLLGETISFENQILYYKSKSILEMANIMISQNLFKIVFVGILVLVFSVIFPLTKLIATASILFNKKLAKNKFIHFMVFKSGKWSMADIMVVAIFMSYIGFSGILSNQLSQLEGITNKIDIITTNNSELQNGFFFFLGFVLISISVSQIILNKFDTDDKSELK